MTDGPASLPADFRQILDAPPHGWELSSRVVQPEIRIRKEGTGFAFRVAGTRTVRGEKKVWDAPGPDYNWVADGNVIRPLPHDTPAMVRQMLGEQLPKTLSFPDVVRLVRLGNPDIPVIAEESVFHSAQSAAADLRPDQDIPGLHATLFPYQAQGVAWMDQTIRHTGGLILADEMGLGKTIQIIALLLCEKPETSRPALIICPTSLIANWRKEIMKFAPELSVLIHRGHNRTGITAGLQRAQVVLSTYDTVVNDISIFAGMTWSWLICDEAQALKNPDSGRRRSVGRIPRQRTIPMTGTPVETSLLDLWSLADLAIPG
ncbi:SNF2-related protein, partial [Erythrobacter sp.]